MKSLVYSLEGEVNNESMFNPNGYLYRFDTQKKYNDVINKIYNDDKVNTDKELMDYLITRPNPDTISIAYELLSIDFIRNDVEIFNALKKCNFWKQKTALDLIREFSNQNIEHLKKLFILLPSIKGDYDKFCKYFCNNVNLDYEIEELVFTLAMKGWSYLMQQLVNGVLKSKIKIDKKKTLLYICKLNDVQSLEGKSKLEKLCGVIHKEDIVNDNEEMERLITIANNDMDEVLENYCMIYKIPEIRTNKEVRDYLFEILNEQKCSGSYDIYFCAMNVLTNEIVRNDNALFEAFLKSNNFDMCYALENAFACKDLVSNKQMMELILKMPNNWCLEQLLLAYETKEINHNIEILTNIASLAPFSDKMEDARLSYGVNAFELKWIDKKIEYARKKDDYIQIEERNKIKKLQRKKYCKS